MEIQNFELHYYFDDKSHTLDAKLRNECERELLALFEECSMLMGIPFDIESEAYSEGGLVELWRFLGTPQLALAVAVLALVMSKYPTTSAERRAAERELLALQTEEARLNVQKLRREVAALSAEKEPDQDRLENIADDLVKSSKVLSRRSNFYEKSLKSKKIKEITYRTLDEKKRPTQPKKTVKRKNFKHFIIYQRKLKPLVIDAAEIEIVSPVLKSGKYKWKGIFDGKPLSFKMSDLDFKHQVVAKEVTFQNGSVITCVLEVERKLDEAGEIVVTGHTVSTVIKKSDSSQIVETPQGRSYLQSKKYIESQEDLFTK